MSLFTAFEQEVDKKLKSSDDEVTRNLSTLLSIKRNDSLLVVLSRIIWAAEAGKNPKPPDNVNKDGTVDSGPYQTNSKWKILVAKKLKERKKEDLVVIESILSDYPSKMPVGTVKERQEFLCFIISYLLVAYKDDINAVKSILLLPLTDAAKLILAENGTDIMTFLKKWNVWYQSAENAKLGMLTRPDKNRNGDKEIASYVEVVND